MFKQLFLKQKQLLDVFFDQIELSACEALVHKIEQCSGIVFLTGVGKSGLIAQKIAATLSSTGTRALYLSPLDALHGDLGMLTSSDLLLLLSKSGETTELLNLLPAVHAKKTCTISLCSNRASRLVKHSDLHVILPCEQELCPFDLAPTTSTEVQLIFGDALAIALMGKKRISLEQYAENHPSGQIGSRSSLKVVDVMLSQEHMPICFQEELLEKTLVSFTSKRCGCLIVIDKNKRLKGIFTDGDLRRALQEKGDRVLQQSMGQLMTAVPKTIDVYALAWDALKLMETDRLHPVTVLPVIDKKAEVVGIVKMHDLIQAGL